MCEVFFKGSIPPLRGYCCAFRINAIAETDEVDFSLSEKCPDRRGQSLCGRLCGSAPRGGIRRTPVENGGEERAAGMEVWNQYGREFLQQ